VHDQGGLGKCRDVGAPHSHKRVGGWEGELMGGVWFAWEMGWKLGLWWHMIKQMGNGNDKV